ncbi:MAG: sigma-70 family RNA polymerase sigma factor [Deltaproteobacteria bacterium]|nr:MAG: sigma-70 family RNA polymerase sigma factor [Deltaproteobacteria bacterium]
MRHDEVPDATLAKRARKGDPEAWRLLVRRHTPMVYRLARRMLPTQEDAEDAAQEVFVRMHKSFHSYDPSRPLSAWLGRITYHVCLRRLGHSARRPADGLDPVVLAELPDDDRPSPELTAADRESDAIVNRAVDQLAAQDRFLIALRYREGLADGEVAEATGMNVNTVRTRLFRARKTLRQLLAPVLGGGREEVTP